MKRRQKFIPSPTPEKIRMYLDKWETLDKYVAQEKSLNKLFLETYPSNAALDKVLVKVSTLNDFYSTNIFSSYDMARHIVALDIDERLAQKDLSLIRDIATLEISGKERYFYSFATKYCVHHHPLNYPIFDGYVQDMLVYFKKKDGFSDFKRDELKDYPSFYKVMLDFRKFYGLGEFTLKDIDAYLWQAGKEYFPRIYQEGSYVFV